MYVDIIYSYTSQYLCLSLSIYIYTHIYRNRRRAAPKEKGVVGPGTTVMGDTTVYPGQPDSRLRLTTRMLHCRNISSR